MADDMTDMKTFNATFGHLAVDPYAEAALAEDIGKRARYCRPSDKAALAEWTRRMGTVARDEDFEIIGVQKIWDGSLAYRVRCLGYDDRFGRPMKPDEAEFLEA